MPSARATARFLTVLTIAPAVALTATSVHAWDFLPVSTKNMNPFMIGYGGIVPDAPNLIRKGEWMTRLKLELANNSITARSSTEEITIDGESYIAEINLRYGYSSVIEISMAIPLVYQSEGFLDQAIKSWHNLWGMSNYRRDVFPNNQLNYKYVRNGNTLVDVDTDTGGIGDIVLGTKFQNESMRSSATSIAYRFDLKLPTGDAGKLTGSGAADAAFSIHAANSSLLGNISTVLYGGAGLVALGKGDILPEQQKDFVAGGYFGASWKTTPRLSLIAQLNYQSAYYVSELSQLGSDSINLYLNASYFARDTLCYELGFGENLFTDPTPDFLLYFSITTRY